MTISANARAGSPAGKNSGPRVKAAVYIAKAAALNMRVNLRRADVRVSEQFLYYTKIGAVLQQVSGEAVAEHVWSDVAGDTGAADPLLNPEPQRDGGERRAALGQKNTPGGPS